MTFHAELVLVAGRTVAIAFDFDGMEGPPATRVRRRLSIVAVFAKIFHPPVALCTFIFVFFSFLRMNNNPFRRAMAHWVRFLLMTVFAFITCFFTVMTLETGLHTRAMLALGILFVNNILMAIDAIHLEDVNVSPMRNQEIA
jgi:hypothetical protein